VDRRAFLAGSVGIFAAPLAAEAQPAGKLYRVGLLSMGTISPQVRMWSAFLDAMRELDYVEGRNLAGRRRSRPHGSLRPPNERSVRISRTTLYREVAGQHRAAN
jgi:hypothetical protein